MVGALMFSPYTAWELTLQTVSFPQVQVAWSVRTYVSVSVPYTNIHA